MSSAPDRIPPTVDRSLADEPLKHRIYVRQLKAREWMVGRALGVIRRRRFTFAGEVYRYHAHPHNTTWRNERTVEVPIAMRALQRHRGGRILELGNVMTYYDPTPHAVIDKYERGPGITNADVADFEPEGRYDLILTISTLEHVGWDEDHVEPDKPIAALERMASWLAPSGELLVTFPLGYNPHIDERVRSGALRFDDLRLLRRTTEDNRWEEIDLDAAEGARYGYPFEKGNVVVVGTRRG